MRRTIARMRYPMANIIAAFIVPECSNVIAHIPYSGSISSHFYFPRPISLSTDPFIPVPRMPSITDKPV